MLGENLLVFPVFNEEGMGNYYLPKGKWTNYFTGEKLEGGQWIEEKHGYMSIKKSGDEFKIKLNAQKSCTIRLVNIVADFITGGRLQIDGNDTILTPKLGQEEITVKVG